MITKKPLKTSILWAFLVYQDMKSIDHSFYKSTAWKKCRASFIGERRSIDGGLCQRCGRNPGYIVHHKIYLSADNFTDPDVALNHDNLEYVCLDCHNDEHLERKHLLCSFDEKGRPINATAAISH